MMLAAFYLEGGGDLGLVLRVHATRKHLFRSLQHFVAALQHGWHLGIHCCNSAEIKVYLIRRNKIKIERKERK
jgi:hypothetical protein